VFILKCEICTSSAKRLLIFSDFIQISFCSIHFSKNTQNLHENSSSKSRIVADRRINRHDIFIISNNVPKQAIIKKNRGKYISGETTVIN
jgi:hypothetical protein